MNKNQLHHDIIKGQLRELRKQIKALKRETAFLRVAIGIPADMMRALDSIARRAERKFPKIACRVIGEVKEGRSGDLEVFFRIVLTNETVTTRLQLHTDITTVMDWVREAVRDAGMRHMVHHSVRSAKEQAILRDPAWE